MSERTTARFSANSLKAAFGIAFLIGLLGILVACIAAPKCPGDGVLVRTVSGLSVATSLVFAGAMWILRDRLARWTIAAGCVLVVAVAFAADGRSDAMEKLEWEFDGPVIRKFRSENHGALSIEVGLPHGGQYEFVGEELWDAAAVGIRVAKVRCSASVAVHKSGKVEYVRIE